MICQGLNQGISKGDVFVSGIHASVTKISISFQKLYGPMKVRSLLIVFLTVQQSSCVKKISRHQERFRIYK